MKHQNCVVFQRLAEKIFVISALLFYTGALLPHLPLDNSVNRIIVPLLPFIIQAVTTCLIIPKWKEVVQILIKERLLWFLLLVALFSVFYSDDPMYTLYHPTSVESGSGPGVGVLPLFQTTLFGVYFSTRHSIKKQFQLLAWVFGITVLLSIVLGLALPRYGLMGASSVLNSEDKAHIGAWQGVYGHKNQLGSNMALSALFFLLFTSTSRKHRWIKWVGFILSVTLILLSTSKTALVVLLTLVSLLPLYKALRWNYTLALPLLITVLLTAGVVGSIFVNNAETILELLGRDATLSGRTGLWDAVLSKISERPWLGYGYQAFWRGWDGESADVWRVELWGPGSAHNGFLELGLDLGLLGLSVFVLSFVYYYFRAITWIRLTKNTDGLWPVAYLTFMILSNMTEAGLVRPDFNWLLYLSIILSMHNRAKNLAET
ncbi:MAG: O-antigen ligase family protein [Chroococcidiopsidaceae cyanobacterium CP_BM_ER_R8_30]|nr:O-antigen ligase family protein [Chroococcidiopsidaceae cyanobacterium CP_BM_ER_R8_30]